MTPFWPYLFPLALTVLCAAASVVLRWGWRHVSRSGLSRTALVLAANAAVGTGYVMLTGIYDPWLFFAVIDSASAAIVLHRPAGRMQAIIGTSYLCQITVHLAYGLVDNSLAQQEYWMVLTVVAFIQLVIVLLWAGGNAAKALDFRRFSNRHRVSDTTHRKGME